MQKLEYISNIFKKLHKWTQGEKTYKTYNQQPKKKKKKKLSTISQIPSWQKS